MSLPPPRPGDPAGQTGAEPETLARGHDEAALHKLVRRCNPRLFLLARGPVGRAAEVRSRSGKPVSASSPPPPGFVARPGSRPGLPGLC